MEDERIFLPVAALVLLTALVWIHMYVKRLRAIQRSGLDPDQFKSRQGKPVLPAAAAPSDNFQNLLEAPVLFYVGAVIIYTTGRVDELYVWLAWGFVALRALHSLVHVTYNRVLHRFAVYVLGTAVLWGMWLRLGLQLWRGEA